MKTFNKLSYSKRIQVKNRILTAVLVLMVIYMVVIGELQLGDSRMMSPLAKLFSRIIFFGGIIYIANRIRRNRKLLNNQIILKEALYREKDEMNRQLHEKSGGVVWDVLLICQLFITLTTSFISMPAFYCAFTTLFILVVSKTTAWLYFYSGRAA